MSEFKTDKISPRSGTTQTIGDSGDSVSTSSGSTINNAGTITTAGITGGTINNTTGEIYLRGEVDWKPSDIKTASFTATDNQGFFVNTTSGQITVTLPASPSAGDVVGIKDYANTFDTNKCILNANGNKIQGSTTNFDITVEGSSIIIIYVDATQGWVITDASKAADISQQALFTVATGGTQTTCGDYKIHTFTSPGTFCVSQAGNCVGGPGNVDYLVVAGGGGGAGSGFGGGGGGGYRTTFPSPGCNAGSFPITATAFPITVGSGGTTGPIYFANPGSNSVFSTITSAGGGRGYEGNSADGGSGGGGGRDFPGVFGSGNTPPVSPPQGNNGGQGSGSPTYKGGGGGGAGGAGVLGSTNGNGGPGSANSITGSSVTRAGGGGGGTVNFAPNPAGLGGPGGGGNGSSSLANGSNGTINTGGGGGGGFYNQPGSPQIHYSGGAGGSGIVIIRYKFQ
ncbi:hypothetical protein N9W29_01325 [Candidatus Pelagibacter bacterium]|nr:hypothetical protein [Candidatus Pelagibacter bacterium]